MKDYMTVKEIAGLCGKTEKTVRNWIAKVFPVKMENGVETRLLIDEVEQLFKTNFGEKITVALFNSLEKTSFEFKNNTKNKDEYGYFYCIELINKDEEFIATKIGISNRRDVNMRISEYDTINTKVGNRWHVYTKNNRVLERFFKLFFENKIKYGKEYFDLDWKIAINIIEGFIETGILYFSKDQLALTDFTTVKEEVLKNTITNLKEEQKELSDELARFRFDLGNY
jgi:hypothetical protein